MSQNLSARQQLNNAIVPLVCFSIIFVVFAFAGQSILMSLLEEDPVDAANMQIIMMIIFGFMLLGVISQFVKAYKRFEAEKNAPPRPATPAQPTAELARAREFQRAPAGIGYQQPTPSATFQNAPGSTVTYSTTFPQPTHYIEREKVIIKEIVKLKCPYCGMLVDQVLSECPNCGGHM
jgi:hypothetical protein